MPESPDPRLQRAWESYSSEAREVPMFEPDEVRRLGTRRRRSRHAAIAGATLSLAVLAGAGVVLGTDAFSGTSRHPQVAGPSITTSSTPTPTPSDSSPSPSSPSPGASSPSSGATTPAATMKPISVTNLPTNQEIYLQKPGDTNPALITDNISSATDEATFWVCDDGISQQPGIVTAKSAIFTEGGNGTFSRAHLIQMDSAASATTLADTIRGWNDTCPARVAGYDKSPATAQNEPTTTVNGVRVDFSVQMFRIDNGEGLWNGVLVLVSGNRVLVVTEFARGMDYNSVGPGMHAENPDLPLVNTARQLDTIIKRMNA